MSQQTKIFVSSTCYDLSPVREEIRNCILSLGHAALLSDFPSFPILPDLDTVQNCKRNVAENTDLFALILGGKRGSLDPETRRPVTNIEYETALKHGIESFVFVKRSVWDLLPVWERNPDADLTHQVDFPEVFTFLKNLKADQKWIFTFERVAEITDTLKTQLSVFLSDLLRRRKQGKLKPLTEFLNETERAQKIALDRPKFWEYLLTEELLRSKLARVRRSYNDLNKGLLFKPSRLMRGSEFADWAIAKCKDIERLFHVIQVAGTTELRASWGAPGEAGDPIKIKRAIDYLVKACEDLHAWELDFISTTPPPAFENGKQKMAGWTSAVLSELEKLPDEIAKPLRTPNPEGTFIINLVITSFPNIKEMSEEWERIRNNRDECVKDW